MTARIAFDRLPLMVCLAGSRNFAREDWVERFALSLRFGTELVHGACPDSPDVWASSALTVAILRMGGRAASWPMPKTFPADWDSEGRAAGPKRNRRMIEYVREKGGVLVAFVTVDADGTPSRGTANAIHCADDLDVPRYAVRLWPDGHADAHHQRFDAYLIEAP